MKKQYMNYMKSCLLVMIACLVSMVGAAQGFSPAAELFECYIGI